MGKHQATKPTPKTETTVPTSDNSQLELSQADSSTGLSASQQRLLNRQRQVGNAAVVQTLRAARNNVQRDDTPQTNIQKLDELLDKFNVPEEEVITLLGQLSPGEKTTVISGGYKSKLASAFNVGEMVRGVKNLGMPLPTALDWVKAAGSPDYADIQDLVKNGAPKDALKTRPWRDWFVEVCTNSTMPQAVADLGFDLGTKIDWMNAEANLNYAEIKNMIVTAPPDQRSAMKNNTYRAIFVQICNNNTMAEAVADLGFDAKTKVDWMVEEGTNQALLEPVLRAATQGELDTIKADPALMARIKDDIGESQWKTIEQMITNGLLQESAPTPETEGVKFNTGVTLDRTKLTVHKDIKFAVDGTFLQPADEATMKQRYLAAITTYLDQKYKVKVVSNGAAQQGDGEYPIHVLASENASASYVVNLHAQQRGRPSMGGSSGDLFELGQTGAGTPDVEMAHEAAHMLLGAPDEYPDPEAPATRVLTNDNSLMANFWQQGIAAAEIKARHFGFLVAEVQRVFPGRIVTIERP